MEKLTNCDIEWRSQPLALTSDLRESHKPAVRRGYASRVKAVIVGEEYIEERSQTETSSGPLSNIYDEIRKTGRISNTSFEGDR
ncbi:hypothetical protein CEXT_470591 [Caerostris extrusa]|uniref:Anticodon-binding domain-containing protein n=1 Tax=Caerostris extrusa TaxID=172846 RepID=A0AAV4RXW5_CAEEX|nr:hypothetical protein CEXT_470591 [Caerostris extrusa]